MTLNFDNDTVSWLDGLLIGNGRLGGVVWHQDEKDIVSLNHEWLWTGTYGNRKPANRSAYLPLVRELLDQKDYYRATALASLAFGGNGGISPIPRQEDMYKCAGELSFTLLSDQSTGRRRSGACTAGTPIQRSLDITHGVATTNYTGLELTAFVDCVGQNHGGPICLQWSCGGEDFSGTLTYERPYESTEKDRFKPNTSTQKGFVYHGYIDKASQFTTKVVVQTDGHFDAASDSTAHMVLQNATYLHCYIDIETSLHREQRKPMCISGEKDFHARLQRHSTNFAKRMQRTTLALSNSETKTLQGLSINKRVARLKEGCSDPELLGIYANFGKYLFVSGSICATLPLHLQGKWNADPSPAWMSDYHFNINIQMNYWFAEQLQYPELTKPLFDYVKRFAKSGEQTAKALYGTRGTVLSLQGDQWAVSTPEAYCYAAWIGGGAWIAQHYWWRYRHSGDTDFLANEAFPLFTKVLEFYEDYTTYNNQGVLEISPSQSPENRFAGTGEYPVSMCKNSAMDVQLLADLLQYAISAAHLLQVDSDKVSIWQHMYKSLPPFVIGADGRLLEWDSEEKQEVDKGHRHFSHLYGAFPSELFSKVQRTEQLGACEKSLDLRMSYDGADPGWSRAWAACLYARFRQPHKVQEHLSVLIAEKASSSLLDLHPKPPRATVRSSDMSFVFQIDGNFGGTRAVIESLVQCYDGHLFLLPAVPKAWSNIQLRGIKLDGGHIVDLEVKDNELIYCAITVGFEPVVVHWQGNEQVLSCEIQDPQIIVDKR